MRLQRTRRAAAAVEFAMISPFLVGLFIGVFEVSRALLVKEALSNAANRAARTGALPGKSNSDLTQEVGDTLSAQKITGYTVTVQVNGVAGDVKAAKADDQISVEVSVPISQVFWISTYFLKPNMVTSEKVVMSRQG